ncbi:DNA alkylation repair enzyme [Antarctobacter heliothermus]|uniref:DNA alkylation repair enzyme n=1 Tax=Antarctobacter heliothermus TaxID=74033 RepID=A0A222E692_9RHOB|nr:DNA alkylation repair protein [Antarctobacter heliothermus]ASP21706.1 DNA alkylation repair enzyme [Antarctobacter heliothermus]
MTEEDALAALGTMQDPEKAAQMAAYHKADRPYLGVANPVLDEMAREWRQTMDLEARVALAEALWQSNIHEARVVAAKLLTQARIRPDDAVWHLIRSWVPSFDAWAVADHACIAGQKRVMADLSRLDEVEGWTTCEHMWTRRAALVITLPLTKLNFPKSDEVAARARVLDWAAGYVPDRDWFIQKAVAWWVRDLSKHDADAARTFLDAHGSDMKAFARKEAGKYLR